MKKVLNMFNIFSFIIFVHSTAGGDCYDDDVDDGYYSYSYWHFRLLTNNLLLHITTIIISIVYRVIYNRLRLDIIIVVVVVLRHVHSSIALSSSSLNIMVSRSTHFLNEVINMSWIVSLLSKDISASCYSFHQNLSLLSFAHFNEFLDEVITISVFHHLIKYSFLIQSSCIIVKVLI